jgi:drug/metabolite transporter (DMT)-like permease
VRWLFGGLLIVAGVVLIVGTRSAGRTARSRVVWTADNKVRAGLTGVVLVVAGLLLSVGPVD